MAKNYFYILILSVFVFSVSVKAQDAKGILKNPEAATIEGLTVYPNPVINNRVYISTKNDDTKEIAIFDLLGKKVLQTTITAKELFLPNVSPGVYIIKITENNATATRKLIVR